MHKWQGGLGDNRMSELKGNTPDNTVAPGRNGDADYLDGQLRELAKQLHARGLTSQLVTYMAEAAGGKHYDGITVTNQAAPERGSLQIEKEGWVTWEYTGSIFDQAGIGKLADEAASLLRAADVPSQREPPS